MKTGLRIRTPSNEGQPIKDGRTGPGNGAWEQTPVYGYPVGLLG